MNEAEMTVQEYVKRRHQEIDLFLAFWEEKLKEGHPHYPNYLPAMSDWDEQEACHVEILDPSRPAH